MAKRIDHRSWQAELAMAAEELGWKRAGGGTIYRSTDEYVFELSAPPPRVGHDMAGSILTKPLALDPIFWEITGNPDLLRKQMAFRVNGVFSVPLFGIAELTYTTEFKPGTIVEQLNGEYAQAEPRLRTTGDFASLVEAHSPPRSGHQLASCVSWCIAMKRPDMAAQLLRDAIDSDLSGGFIFPGGSFEELALDHLGFENERGRHVELIDGRLRRIFPGARWTPEERLAMDLARMNGAERFALALWKLSGDADRRVVDERWDSGTYIQCAGGPERFLIEVRRAGHNQPEHLIVGHHGRPMSGTVDIRRGEHASTINASEAFSRDETLDILAHYVEHDAVPDEFSTRPLGPAAEVTDSRPVANDR